MAAVFVFTLCFLLHLQSVAAADKKRAIGWVEKVYLPQYEFLVKAKVDTGARNSSIHATDIQYVDSGTRSKRSRIRFRTLDFDGRPRTIEAEVVRTVRIRKTSLSSDSPLREERVEIQLEMCLAGITKKIRVNLTDRTGMNYRLILGRSALQNDFIVDVSQEFIGGPSCRAHTSPQ
jgi:hypothetical protein